ncbi:MAG: polysaccharide biosynthesis tyrosine autokinase [Acidobacteria bacterium]|nr:polysaccharide biosynthesis tyrosine autokinase [Acidobacteriota bacterium]
MANDSRELMEVPPGVRLPDNLRAAFWGPPPVETEAEAASVPLTHYLWVLKRHRWKILGFVAAALAATLVVSSRIMPVFEATATVDIDRQMPPGIVGQEASRTVMNDSDQFIATQVRLVQSDSVLRPVAQRYRLLERERQVQDLPPAARTSAEDAPVLLKKLKVTRPPNTYLLLISYRSPEAQLAADVSNAIAQSYLEHTYNIRIRSSASLSSFMEKQIEELRAKMERSSQALVQFERELNVISPEEKTSILSARLLQLNTEFTRAQADRVGKEAAFHSARGGTPEAALVSGQGESLRKLSERVNETEEKFAEAKAHYGANHPEYRRLAAQRAELQRQFDSTRSEISRRIEIEFREALNRESMFGTAVKETKAEFDRLNARSFEYQSLKREAEADKKLYEELVRKIKEAGINAGFQNSSIRIADPARPPVKPVFPNVRLNLLLAFLFSTLLAVGVALVSDVLDNTVRDPEQVARTLNTEVIGSLPVVKAWRGRIGPAVANGASTALVKAPDLDLAATGFEEAIRTLRNSILLADFDRRMKSLLVTSAAPGEGKSTTAAHLATAHAEQGYRTLLIDGDLRRPSVHRRFNVPGALGLSNVLVAETPWRDALVRMEHPAGLHILPAGPPSRRASDLIGRGLVELLEEASLDYDLVILDAPPMLGFAEPLQMATAVDGVVVVARAGETPRNAVSTVLATLTRLRAKVLGVVLNEVHKETSRGYYYYTSYRKYYGEKNGKVRV